MLAINQITNVNNTIKNNKISFTSGVQSNFVSLNYNDKKETNVANEKKDNLFTDFMGAIKQIPLFKNTLLQRQVSIEKGLEEQENKINAIA